MFGRGSTVRNTSIGIHFSVGIFYATAKVLTILFYFVYSVLPSLFALFFIKIGVPVYFWPNLSEEVQCQISYFQILGFIVLLVSIPKSVGSDDYGKVRICVNKSIVRFASVFLCIYAIPALIQLIFMSRSVSGRNELFALSAGISSHFFLNFAFLLMTIFTLFGVYQSRMISRIYLLAPYVLFDVVSLGRVWIYTSLIVFLFSHVLCYGRLPRFRYLIYLVVLFVAFSLARLGVGLFDVDFGSVLIYIFGEAFNTSQSIEIAYISAHKLDPVAGALMLIGEFIPFGLKGLVVDSANLSINIIDEAKTSVYGEGVEMGFGSSWFSQAIINFGMGWHVIFLPLTLSLSLWISIRILRISGVLGMYYLFFYTSGLFIFMRYGLNLSLSYPFTNLTNFFVLFLLLGFMFRERAYSAGEKRRGMVV